MEHLKTMLKVSPGQYSWLGGIILVIAILPMLASAQQKKPPVKMETLQKFPDTIEMVSASGAEKRKIKKAVEIYHPIYMIDGKLVVEPTYLGIVADDIKEVKIIKVAEAKVKYGEKGLNGAVHIITFSGKGALNINSDKLDPLYREKYTWAIRANPDRYAKEDKALDLFLFVDDN